MTHGPTPDTGDTINDLVNYAIVRWVEVTGTDPDRTSFTIGGAKWSHWDKTRLVQDIEAARDLDPSGLAAFLMLRGSMEEYLRDTQIPAIQLLTDPASVEALLGPLRDLRAVLEHRRVAGLADAFAADIARAAAHHGYQDADGLRELLADKWRLAQVVRDAHRSMKTLAHHQFSYGEPDPRGFKLCPDVYEFWNINSVLRRAAAQAIPGITIVLVRDPVVLTSYFAVVACNGESITVLTDRDAGPHPDHKHMSRPRAAARAFERRAEAHWFPWQLLDLEVSADRKTLFARSTSAIVPHDVAGVKVGELRAFSPEQFVWYVLLAELMRQRYGVEHARLPETSYTGEMVVNPEALVGADSGLVRSGRYRPLELAPLTGADVSAEATAPQWREKPSGHNEWLLARYAARVPDGALNAVGAAQLPAAASSAAAVVGDGGLERARYHQGAVHREGDALDRLDPLTFGTRAEIERDRRWVGRKNLVAVVQTLALQEYDATRDDVLAWCAGRLQERADWFLDVAAHGSLVLPSFHTNYENSSKRWDMVHGTAEAVMQLSAEKPGWIGGFEMYCATNDYDDRAGRWKTRGEKRGVTVGRYGEFVLAGGQDRRSWFCYDLPTQRATVATRIAPNCPRALAAVFGVDESALPWQLAHWFTGDHSRGNPILNRLDPADWRLTNPWRDLRLRVVVHASKRALNARRAKLGLPPKDWSTCEEKRER